MHSLALSHLAAARHDAALRRAESGRTTRSAGRPSRQPRRRVVWVAVFVTLAVLLSASGPALAAAPSEPPANLRVNATAGGSISLAWDPPPAGTDVDYVAYTLDGPAPGGGGYGGALSSATFETSHDFIVLACGSTYKIGVAWGKTSTSSEPSSLGPYATITASTQPCTGTPPAPPTGLEAVDIAGGQIIFEWDAPADADVVGVGSTFSGLGVSTLFFPPSPGQFTESRRRRLVCGQEYTLNVFWVDSEGLASEPTSVSAETVPCEDVGPVPPAPTGLHLTRASRTGLSFAWDAAAPDSGVVRERTVLHGPGAPPEEWHSVRGSESYSQLACASPYDFSIALLYNDGRLSQPATVSASTLPCEPPPRPNTGPPTQPPPPNPQPGRAVPSIAGALGPKTVTVDSKGRFALGSISVSCPVANASPCRASLDVASQKPISGKVTSSRRPRRLRLGRTRFQIAPGARSKAEGKLSRSGLKTLTRLKQVKVAVTLKAASAAGSKTRVFKLTLRRPRRRGAGS